ncbi:MAG: nicotinate (nicotinamide) nucleotide adenylyltransferase [Spirochaetales bacterium]|nr:nicotinate (nicotinamide) nucleotide adenylyltransferase [Spirochaetales bacterium]
MNVAILGGTFNPPHYGHLFLANEVRQKFFYDKIIFVPSYFSPHKSKDLNISDYDRLNLLKLAIDKIHWAEFSDCDIVRGGVTRTIDTIRDIKKIYKLDNKPGFIIGDDLLDGFKNWKEPDQILIESDLIVGLRNNKKIKSKYNIKLVENKIFPLSSSEIRDRVSKSIDVDFLLPSKVIEYINEKNLYRYNS